MAALRSQRLLEFCANGFGSLELFGLQGFMEPLGAEGFVQCFGFEAF